MKALVLKKYGEFMYEEVPDPEIGDSDVLIEVKACGICGSDVHGMDGSTGRRQPPIIMGHEASGVIAEVSSSVAGWNKGDRVTFDSTVYCGECWFCRRGEINLCDNRRVLGVSCEDYRRHGAFADYVAVPQRILYRLPDGVSFEQAAIVEPLSVATHAVERTPILSNDTAVVVGVGMIGLLVVQVLRAAGCGTIVGVDIEPEKLELARKLGADVALDATDCDVAKEVLELTAARGADIAVEAVGVSAAIKTAVGCLRKGATLTLVGNLSPEVELPLQSVVTREITLNGSCASRGEFPMCLDLIAKGQVNVDALVSAVAPLSKGASWFDRLYKKEKGLMKVILKP
ncbi:zinc-binding alcohol dehydrogenase [candidate division BRC1 bacterium SM23_51]|nr:MAG: zinc-binding alcohol dehydrogenase [candidate division BRC1 bacterium SM23_51]